jgi:hypothetical protein
MYISTSDSSINCNNRINLVNTFRKLWEQHVMWTRSFIISTAANLGDLQLVTKRLLRNPKDFANVLKKYYEDITATKFESLLTDHLAIAGRLVNAAKAGDTKTVNMERIKWYTNADEIANFLSSINPYWSKNEWKIMLQEHLKMTEDQATERLHGEYAKDIEQYGIIEDEALLMADYMANGIARQFNI